MLAFVIAIGRAEGLLPGLITFGLSLGYVGIMLLGVRPLLRRLQALYEQQGGSSQVVFPVVLILMLLSATATEWIGIHALFGAFLMGAIMPKDHRFVALLTQRLEDLTVIFLLPVFFAYAGLRTQIGLLDSPYLWGLTALVVLVACLGKFGGSTIAARVSGLSWRESSAIGILMNTRGLVELVILTIGLEMGVITDAVFAMMVIMALVTTAMTTPVLNWVFPQRLFAASGLAEPITAPEKSEFGILIPVSRPESATGLSRIACSIAAGSEHMKAYALSLRPTRMNETLGTNFSNGQEARDVAAAALVRRCSESGVPAERISIMTRDVASDIVHVARAKNSELVLMGYHKSLFGSDMLGGTVHRVLTGADRDVAVLVDRGIESPSLSILVPYQGTPHDRLAVDIVRRMAKHPQVSVTILHVVPRSSAGDNRGNLAGIRKQQFPNSVDIWVIEDASPVDAVLRQSGDFNLIVLGLSEEWGFESHLFGRRTERIARDWSGSLLLVRKYLPYDLMKATSSDRTNLASATHDA